MVVKPCTKADELPQQSNGVVACSGDLRFNHRFLCQISRETRWCQWFSLKSTPKLKKALKVEAVIEEESSSYERGHLHIFNQTLYVYYWHDELPPLW